MAGAKIPSNLNIPLGQTETIDTGAGIVKVSHDILGHATMEQGPIVSPFLSAPLSIAGSTAHNLLPTKPLGMGSVKIENTGLIPNMNNADFGLQNLAVMPTFARGPLLVENIQRTNLAPQFTNSRIVLAPEVNSHVVHGENTVQTSARLATPQEIADLKAMKLQSLNFFGNYQHGPLLESSGTITRFPSISTFQKTVHDAPADVHIKHGEETEQTTARLATPEEIAQLKASKSLTNLGFFDGYQHGPLLESSGTVTVFPSISTFQETIHDAPADVHTSHGEETVQTSARLATPEEIAQLKAEWG